MAIAVTLVLKVPAAKLFASVFGGAATGTAATIGGAAIAAAAGSVASQVVGIATGIQEKFSWKGVAMAAISGAVGAGLGGIEAFDKLGNFGAGAARAALGSAISQGIGVATGLQDKFSWAGVAAAGVTAGVSTLVQNSKFAQKIGRKVESGVKDYVGAEAAARYAGYTAFGIGSAAGAIAGAATRSAIDGSNFGDNLKAAIPDVIGQAIGGLLAEDIARGLTAKKLAWQSLVSYSNPVETTAEAAQDSDLRNVRFSDGEGGYHGFDAEGNFVHVTAEDLELRATIEQLKAMRDTPMLEPAGEPNWFGKLRMGVDELAEDMMTSRLTAEDGLANGLLHMAGSTLYQLNHPVQTVGDMLYSIVTTPENLTVGLFSGSSALTSWAYGDLESARFYSNYSLEHMSDAAWGGVTALSFGRSSALRGLGGLDGVAKYTKQGFSLAQAEHLAAPYTGMGHHFYPRNRKVFTSPFTKNDFRINLPSSFIESRFNVLSPKGISRGDFYELHYKVDPNFKGTRLLDGIWQGSDLGLQKYGQFGRLWYGSPTPLKFAVGSGTVGVGGASYWYLNNGD